MSALRVALAAGACAALLGACALPSREPLGAPVAEVLGRLGVPTLRVALPGGGERLLYSQLPAGSEVHVLDFDAAGRLERHAQTLQAARFEQIPPGQWTREAVLREFGPPLRVERVARFDGEVWTYRFKHLNDLRLAHLHIDREARVQQLVFTDESPNIADPRD